MEKKFKGKTRIVIEKDGVRLSLPKSDAQIMKTKKPEHCDMFIIRLSAKDTDGVMKPFIRFPLSNLFSF